MSEDKSTVIINLSSGEALSVVRDDYEILSGSGGGPTIIEGGRSYVIAEILGVVASGLLDKDLPTLQEYLEWCEKEIKDLT